MEGADRVGDVAFLVVGRDDDRQQAGNAIRLPFGEGAHFERHQRSAIRLALATSPWISSIVRSSV